jgi:hypothetical protein
MDQRKGILIAAGIALLVSLLIIGAILLVNRILKSRSNPEPTPTVVTSNTTPEPVVMASPETTTQTDSVPQNNQKTVTIGNAVITYPNNWALLKCSNSSSVEFDPYGGADQINVVCGRAVKPITIVVPKTLACRGETVTLGSNRVVRSIDPSGGRTDYTWCITAGTTNLQISHRTSPNTQPATSRDDFARQVEEMISNIRLGGS